MCCSFVIRVIRRDRGALRRRQGAERLYVRRRCRAGDTKKSGFRKSRIVSSHNGTSPPAQSVAHAHRAHRETDVRAAGRNVESCVLHVCSVVFDRRCRSDGVPCIGVPASGGSRSSCAKIRFFSLSGTFRVKKEPVGRKSSGNRNRAHHLPRRDSADRAPACGRRKIPSPESTDEGTDCVPDLPDGFGSVPSVRFRRTADRRLSGCRSIRCPGGSLHRAGSCGRTNAALRDGPVSCAARKASS